MMKLAWLCYDYDEWLKASPHNDYVAVPEIRFEEPSPYMYHKIIPIVYAVLEIGDDCDQMLLVRRTSNMDALYSVRW
jgi:hypothetical protein